MTGLHYHPEFHLIFFPSSPPCTPTYIVIGENMTDVEISRTEIKTFKARIKASRPHYLSKAISSRKTLKDGLNQRFKTNFTVFMPKLTFNQKIPVVMLHVGNSSGSCLMRSSNPIELADKLEELTEILRSDIWLDMFQELENISSKLLLNHELVMDDIFIDTGSFRVQAGLKKGETFPFLEVVEKC